MNLDLFEQDASVKRVIHLPDATLEYYPHFFLDTKINFDLLKEKIHWTQDEILLYGKVHKIPRMQAWYGDTGCEYSYSGVSLKRNQWSDFLFGLKSEIENSTGFQFNGCLCNLYRDGNDYVSWHSDDEPELGKNPIIASASFGGERKFVMMHKFNKGIEKFELVLEDKSLLVMKGRTQHFWKHQIAKTKKNVGARVNLTFRKIG